jgi:HlyD family secretion protein
MSDERKTPAIHSIDRHLRFAAVAIGLLVFGAGGWALTTELAGAVLASGTVVVEGNVKAVQHPLGGVVEEIAVRNGSTVRQGDVVLRLDDDVARADLALYDTALDALYVRRTRLKAERDGQSELGPVVELMQRTDEPDVAELIASETRYFDSRTQARSGLKAQLRQRIAQLQEEIDGLRVQSAAQEDAIALMRDELEGLERLYAQKIVARTRMLELKREESAMRGALGQQMAQIASSGGRVAETELQILQIDQELRNEVTKELREANEKIAELTQRRIGALDQLKRVDIQAPHDGIVHELAVHTVGGVIAAGDTLMWIVPGDEMLSVEVNVAAQDRDQLHLGQDALMRMSAFNQRTTPEIYGEVSVIAADLVEDQRTGLQYYPVRLRIPEEERERLGENILAPGMPVETFIQTGQRTILSYLVKPLSDYLTRAFRAD